jgi:hypothetical protein
MQLRVELHDRSYVKEAERFLLRYIYTDRISVLENESADFDNDYILPIQRLKEFIPLKAQGGR